MKYLLLLSLFIGCREFYDEEFEQFEEENRPGTFAGQDGSYTTSLTPIDPAWSELRGNALVTLTGDGVKIDADLSGVPENVIQPHYSIIEAPCSRIEPPIFTPAGNSSRTYSIQETLSDDAFTRDLNSAGATIGPEMNLQGKSFIVKAFSNFAGTPSPTGTNQMTIACGELRVADDRPTGGTFPFPREEGRVDDFPTESPFPIPGGTIPNRGDVGAPDPDRGDVGGTDPTRGDVGSENLPPGFPSPTEGNTTPFPF